MTHRPFPLSLLALLLLSSAAFGGDRYLFDAFPAPLPVDGRTTLVLEGILGTGDFFGPPGYGEDPANDSIEHPYILQVPREAVFRSENEDDEFAEKGETHSTHWIHLAPGKGIDFSGLKGKRIRVAGKAFFSFTAHHRTRVLLEVRTVEEIREFGRLRRKE